MTEAAWAPDGKTLAYVSDQTGEQQVWLTDQDGRGEPRQLTTDNDTWLSGLTWARDGKRVLFTDKRQRLWDLEVATGKRTLVDTSEEGAVYDASYSHDGSWIAYVLLEPNGYGSIWLHNTRTRSKTRLTSAFNDDFAPTWDPKGRYLYFASRRAFDLVTNVFEFRIVHRLTDLLYVVRLTADGPDPLAPLSDEEVDAKGEPDLGEDEPEDKKRDKRKERKKHKKVVLPEPALKIDLAGISDRVQRLPVEDAVLFLSSPGHPDDGKTSLKRLDLTKREVKTVRGDVAGYELAASGDKILYVDSGGTPYVTAARADAEQGDRVSTSGLATWIDPRAEWKQTLDEVRRYLRDYFYDPAMHGHDWNALHDRYAALLPRATTPADVQWLVGELISELNVGHAYTWGNGSPVPRVSTGRLGADLVSEDGGIRIAHVLAGEPGDPARESPLRAPGVDVADGAWLLAIDGQDLGPSANPYRYLVGTVGRPVRLKVGLTRDATKAREVVVRPIASDAELRYWDQVQANRRKVAEATGGRVGYVHLPNTSTAGYAEFVRALYAQHHLDGLVIDVRFNGGGFIPEMFIEFLLRPLYNTWVPRDGRDWRTPGIAMHGPKVVITNGYAGSGGDAFPYYFRQFGLGKLVGETTWGGLVGIQGAYPLLIGGGITAPSFAFVNRDGEWDVERKGVAPDIPVIDPPEAARKGLDPQLDKAIEVIVEELKTWKSPVPPRPKTYPTPK